MEGNEETAFDDHSINRRQLLSGMATTTLGLVALPGGRGLAAVTETNDSTPPDRPGTISISARLAKDGLPIGSVAGTYVGADRDFVLIGVDAPAGVVRARITKQTKVTSGGVIAYGDVSHCNVGDRAHVGTVIDPSGIRVAEYLFTNGMAYWADVVDVGDQSLTVAPYAAGTYWPAVTMLTIPWTTVYPRGGGSGVTGIGAAREVLQADNEYIHVTCIADEPGLEPATMWAITIHQ